MIRRLDQQQLVYQRRRADCPLRACPAYTLVELLVVIAIIGVLLGLLLPAVQAARESARRAACQNNLKQIGVGINNYLSAMSRFPPGKKWSGPRNEPTTYSIGWSAYLLDFAELGTVLDKIDFKKPLTSPVNLKATGTIVDIYLCPSTNQTEEHRQPPGILTGLGPGNGDGMACIDYLGISGPDKKADSPVDGENYGPQRGILIGTKGFADEDILVEPPPVRPKHVTDGLSNTACVSECTGRGVDVKKSGEIDALNGAWASGSNVTHIDERINKEAPPKAWRKERIFSEHPGGANVLLADGSVHFVSEEVSGKIIRGLCSRDGGETTDGDAF